MMIFLNPGHHRELDSGAVNPVTGLREADVAWAIGVEVQSILTNAGIEAPIAQLDSLEAICAEANSYGADYFVSIHCNAFNTVAQGTEVCVYQLGSTGAEFGQSIQDQIVGALNTVDRGLKERPGLYVLRNTDMPACLVETAFIDNADDGTLLATRQSAFAKAIADGILAFIGLDASPAMNTSIVAPNGLPFEENDVAYLISQGYTRAAALSFLALSPKYANTAVDAAVAWAESRVGTEGYGNNGCTAFVRDFLLQAGHPIGQLMADGSQGNLMWVPTLMDYAKANGLWKAAELGGAPGDVCVLETNYCFEDGPDHVVIACGDGDYWGNSSSRNRIVRSSIADDYGASNVWGYVTTGVGGGTVAIGAATRSAAEIIGDAGSTSYVNLSSNGMVYEENDIQYLLSKGYDLKGAIELLSTSEKYTRPVRTAPNGKQFEWNDVQYLLNQGYTEEAAYVFLASADKYLR